MTAPRLILGDEDHASARRRRLAVVTGGQALVFLAVLVELVLPTHGEMGTAIGVLGLASCVAMALAVRQLVADHRSGRDYAESTIDLAASVLMALDREGRVRMANVAACEVIGRPECAVLGEHIHDRIIAGQDAHLSRAALERVLRGDIDPRGYRSVRTVTRPDGGTREVAWEFAVRHDRRGQVLGLLLSGEDVTGAMARDAANARERADLELLRSMGRDAGACEDGRGIVVERVKEMVEASLVVLAEVEPVGIRFTQATDASMIGLQVPFGETSGCLEVVRTGEPLIVENAFEAGYVNPFLVQLTQCAGMRYEPVVVGEEVVAVLAVGWFDQQPTVDDRRAKLLQLAADAAGTAMQRRATLQRLQSMALTDALTGVPNRRCFDDRIRQALAQAKRDGQPLTQLLLDLDGFKTLNDSAGHDAGDRTLVECAAAWNQALRPYDTLARLGGDEFAIILPGCDDAAAVVVAERLRAATPHNGVSIGIARWQGETEDDLYAAADRALYADKAHRRRSRLAEPRRVAAVRSAAARGHARRTTLQGLVDSAQEGLGSAGVYINLVDGRDVLHIVRPSGQHRARTAASRSFCAQVVESGRQLVVTARLEEEDAGDGHGVRSYAGAPLTDSAGNVLGAVCACDGRPHNWTASELRTLALLASDVSRALVTEADEDLRRAPAASSSS